MAKKFVTFKECESEDSQQEENTKNNELKKMIEIQDETTEIFSRKLRHIGDEKNQIKRY